MPQRDKNQWVTALVADGDGDIFELQGYAAVDWSRGRFRTTALCVDRERRQDLRLMPRDDVLASIDLALARGCHVAVNYLNCPGVTDFPVSATATSIPI